MTPAKFWSRYAIAESVWRAEMPAGCSRPSSPPNRTAWAWACRSADRSSSPTAGGYRPPATPGPAPRSSSSCRGTRRATRRDRQLDIASRRGRRGGADRLRGRRRRLGAGGAWESPPLGGPAGPAVRLGARISAEQARRRPQLPDPRLQTASRERPRLSGGPCRGGNPYPDHLHDGSRRYSDDGQGDESRCRRLSDQAVSRSGHAGCRDGGDRTRPKEPPGSEDPLGPESALRNTERPGAGGIDAGHGRPDEQTGRGRDWHCRDHREDTPRQHHAKNGGEIARRAGEDGPSARRTARRAAVLNRRIFEQSGRVLQT